MPANEEDICYYNPMTKAVKEKVPKGRLPRFKTWSKKRIFFSFLLLLFSFASFYMLMLIFAPEIDYYLREDVDEQVKGLETEKVINLPNGIIIPSIKVTEPILEGGEEVLGKGAWHRKPEMGNPELGGNFILTGHRYSMEATPGQVVANSPFYDIDKLQVGEVIYVVWNKKPYKYRIEEISEVAPTQVEIEEQSDSHQLTLYTCTLGGRWDGRIVIEAKPLFEI